MCFQSSHHWSRLWLVAWSAPSHYLNQCWNVVNWTLRIKFKWNFNRNAHIFIQANAFQKVVCKMSAIVSRPQCVKLVFDFLSWFFSLLNSHFCYEYLFDPLLPKCYFACVIVSMCNGAALLPTYSHRCHHIIQQYIPWICCLSRSVV